MGYRLPLVNFTKGEVSEDMLARFDVQAYQASLKRAENVVILKQGGIERRPGFEFVGRVYTDNKPSRLIPFQFSNTQAYVIEMGNGGMRLAAQGGLVVEPELRIEFITNEAQAVVTINFHGFSVGDDFLITGVEGMTGVNGRVVRVVDVIDQHRVRVDLNTVGAGPFATAQGGEVRTGPPSPPPPPPPPPTSPSPPPEPPEAIPPLPPVDDGWEWWPPFGANLSLPNIP